MARLTRAAESNPARTGAIDRRRAILLATLAAVAFSTMDALVKLSVSQVPVAYVGTLRYLIQTTLLILVIRRSTGHYRLPQTSVLRLQMVRGVLLLAATISFWVALRFIPLSEATALSALSPVISATLAILFLGERSSRRQSLAIGAGAIGALLIVQPGTSLFDPAAFLALGTAFAYASFEVITRGIGAGDPASTTLFYTGIVGLAAMSVIVFAGPIPGASGPILAVICVISACGMAGHYCLIRALQLAPVPVVAPLSYSSLLWAAIYGVALFGQLPNPAAIVGMTVICAAGILLVQGRPGEPAARANGLPEDEVRAHPWPE